MAGRYTQDVVEVLYTPSNVKARYTQDVVEILYPPSNAKARYTQNVVEILYTATAASSYDETVTLTTASDIAFVDNFTYNETLTLTAASNITTDGSISFENSLSLDIDSDITFTDSGFNESLTLANISTYFTFNITQGYNDELTLSATNAFFQGTLQEIDGETYPADTDITFDFEYIIGGVLTETANSNFTIIGGIDFNPTLNLSADADMIFQGGFPYNEIIPALSSNAIISFLDGLAFAETLSFDVVATDNYVLEHFFNDYLELSADTDYSTTFEYFSGEVLNLLSLTNFEVDCFNLIQKPVSQTLTLSQSVGYIHIINQQISQTLTLTQEAYRLLTGENELNFIQTLTLTRSLNKVISQNLNLSQNINKNSIFTRSASNVLTFIYTRLFENSIRNIYLPSAIGTVSSRRCRVILKSKSNIIVLPCPRFGDTEGLITSLTIKKAIDGTVYSYVKRGSDSKLKYSFWLGTKKSLELRQFLIDNLTESLILSNWKGEEWLVKLTNNPFEFSPRQRYQPEIERVDIVLEFEGVRIA